MVPVPSKHFRPRLAERLALHRLLQRFSQMPQRRYTAAGQCRLRLTRTVEHILLDRKLREKLRQAHEDARRLAEITLDICHTAAHPKLRARS